MIDTQTTYKEVPCAKRLPEKGKNVLVILDNGEEYFGYFTDDCIGPDYVKELTHFVVMHHNHLGVKYTPICWFEKQEGVVVIAKEDFEEEIKESAQDAWTNAANAYRLYPNNKHTFSAYWNNRHF